METIIYKIELTSEYAFIFTMTTKGDILNTEEVSASSALKFAHANGLSFMEDSGEAKYYW